MPTFTGDDGDDRIIGSTGDDVISGLGGNDEIAGEGGRDILFGGDGTDILSADRNIGFDNELDIDHIFGEGGNDYIFAGYGDVVDGGSGFDTVYLSYLRAGSGITGDTATLFAGQPLVAGSGTLANFESFSAIALTAFDDRMVIGNQDSRTTIYAWDGDDTVTGQQVSVILHGGNGNDLLVGSTSDDTLLGDDGNDRLVGGQGNDVYSGGEGADRFIMDRLEQGDWIVDFRPDTDIIDLSAIDANIREAGNQAFTYIGFEEFSGMAGELRGFSDATRTYYVAGDVDGDRVADFLVHVSMHYRPLLLSADFLL